MVQLDTVCSVRDQIRIDGIHYEITARHISEGMCRATWNCSVCNERGGWASLANDPTEAIEMAAAGIRVHHSFLHQAIRAATRSAHRYWLIRVLMGNYFRAA